jgi:hypothetical protein
VRTLAIRDSDFIFKPKRKAGSQDVGRILGGGGGRLKTKED